MTRLPPDAFLGRGLELAALDDALAGGARLVSVLGPPGVGKTRLARRYLEDVAARPGAPSLRAFCDVAWATSADDVLSALVRTLAIPDGGDGWLALAAALDRRGGALLVVDNFEPVARFATETLGRLLAATRRVCVVVTSRVRLRLEGERVVDVAPLSLPAEGASDDDAARSEAVLFLASRAQLDPRKNAAALAEIARRLEGLPLALELAAARLDLLSARELMERLSAPLDVLTRGRRDAEARQASLRSALEASFGLLSQDEQRALARLAVFQGGFSLPAAEAVIGETALDAVQGLVEASLVNRRPDDGGGARYGMYDAVRDFAAEKLREGGELDDAHARHARFYLALADEAHEVWQRRRDAGARELVQRLAREEVNLAAVLKRRPRSDEGLRAARALGVLAQAESGALARLPLLRLVLDDEGAEPRDPLLLAWAIYWQGALERTVGRGPEVTACLARLTKLAPACEEPALRCAFLHLRATVALDGLAVEGGVDPLDDLEQVAQLARANGLREAHAWNLLASARAQEGDGEEALRAAERALARAREENDATEVVAALATFAHLRALEGDFHGAAAALARVDALLGDETVPPRVLTFLTWLRAEHLHGAGDLVQAQRAAAELLALAQEHGFTRYEGSALHRQALLHLERGHASKARELATQALGLFEAAAPRWLERALPTLIAALAAEGAVDQAADTLTRLSRGQGDASARSEPQRRLAEALLDVARARAARAAGAEEEADTLERRARTALGAPLDADTAVFLRLLTRELEGLKEQAAAAPRAGGWPDDALVLDEEGAFFRPPGGALVDTERRPVLKQVLRALVDAHAERGTPLSVDALFAAAWPGQKAAPDAVRARVRVAISTLRKEGLRDVIVTHGSAYTLREGTRVLRVGQTSDTAVKIA